MDGGKATDRDRLVAVHRRSEDAACAHIAAIVGSGILLGRKTHRWIHGGARCAPVRCGAELPQTPEAATADDEQAWKSALPMKTGNNFLDRLIDRMDRLDPSSLQTCVLRLVRQKGFLETIFNTIQEGVIVIDERLRVQYINIAAQRLLGIQEAPLNDRIDKHLREVDWRSLLSLDPEEWHRVSRQEIEVFYPSHRYISFYIVPVRGDAEGDELPLATIILRDVTQKHQDTEKTIESQKVQAITMLAAGVAHELGNPLNSLNIHLQLLGRCVGRIQDEDLRNETEELLGIATHEVERLDAIVSHFLQAVRPVPPKLERLMIQGLLAESLVFMRPEIEHRQIRVEATLPEEVPAVLADPDQLKQAFYNIIKNAMQAMPDGGLLQIVCSVGRDFLDVRFANTGKGITPEEMSRLMDPYYTTRTGGTGLGLVIVDRIVRGHGGELGIESDENGAAFTIRLPLRERQMRLLQAPPAADDAMEGLLGMDEATDSMDRR